MGPDDDPFFAMVGRDQISIMLKEIATDVKAIPNHRRHEWARWDAYIYTADPDMLFEEYRSRGVVFRQPIRDDDDGLRGFEVMDERLGAYGFYWTSTEYESKEAWFYNFAKGSTLLNHHTGDKNRAFSVRCIKDILLEKKL
jgi:uncharacterized protein (TIGR02145 family)